MKNIAKIIGIAGLLLTLVSCGSKKKDIVGFYDSGFVEITETTFIRYSSDKRTQKVYEYKWINEDVIEVNEARTTYYYFNDGKLYQLTGYEMKKTTTAK